MKARLWFCRLAAVATLLFIAGAATAQERVRIRAGAHDGFGRIAFDWPKPVTFQAAADGLTLTVRFARPFKLDPNLVRARLPRYVGAITTSDTKRSISFELLQPVTVKPYAYGKTVVVDLQQPLPAAGGEAQPPLEGVSIRGGEHGNFSRVVFDWRRDVTYKVEQTGREVVVTFDRAAAIDDSAIAGKLPKLITGISSQVQGRRTVAAIMTTQESPRARHMRVGRKVVVDILPGRSTSAAKPDKPGGNEVVASTKAPAPVPLASKPAAPAAKPEKTVDRKAKPRTKAPLSLLPKEAARTTTAPAARLPEATVASTAADAPVSTTEDTDGAVIKFSWAEPVAAAAFERAGYIWVLFDRNSEFPVDKLGGGESSIQLVQQIRHRRATILRFKVRGGLFPTMRRDGTDWLLTFKAGKGGAANALAVVPQPRAEAGARVFFPVIDTGRRIELYDPEVGDELLVVPVLPSGTGVPARYDFAEFQVLPSVQGLVVRAFVDDMSVKPLRNGIAVSSDAGLSLSPPEVAEQALARPSMAASYKARIMNFTAWLGDPTVSFSERRQALIAAGAKAPRAGRNAARWRLAKFEFAHGFIPEALAQLRLMQEIDDKVQEDSIYLAVRGAAHLLANRLPEARSDLMDPALDRFPDVAIWRGALMLRERRFDDANRQFAIGAGSFVELPKKYRFDLLLDWGQAAVDANDVISFQAAADLVKRHAASPRLISRLEYLRGRAAELNTEIDTALEHYDRAIAQNYRPILARARFAHTNAALRLNQIDLDEAILRLKKLAFSWRGDEFEVSLIRRLADLALIKGDNRLGLELLRLGMMNFPDILLTRDLGTDMSKVFLQLFLNGGADRMSPVSALALYNDFQELTPIGRRGDEMIRKLADRLVAVDLLDQAGRLLDYQIQFRLKGQERARVGTQLALIRLLDRDPEQALEAIDRSGWVNLPDDMVAERRYLRVQALSDLDRSAEALQLLADDDSERGRLMKADIHWATQSWNETAEIIDRTLGDRWQGAQALNEDEQSQVMKLAVSLYMSDEIDRLAQMGARYGGRMQEGVYGETFRLLTDTVDPTKTDFRKLASSIAGIAGLESFMSSYRTKLAQNGLSAIN